MSNIFDLTDEYLTLKELSEQFEINEETGEFIDNSEIIKELFNEINGDIADKFDNTMYVIKDIEAQSDLLKKEKMRLSAKQIALENKAKYLKGLMVDSLNQLDDKKIKGKHSFSIRKSKAVNILDENLIARKYKKTIFQVQKKDILTDLKDGVIVDGAEIVENKSLSAR